MNKRRIADYVIESRERHYRLAYSYVKNSEDALDVVQESICKAMSSLHTLQSPEHLRTWYYRIVVNTALDFLRKRKKLVPVEEVFMPEEHSHIPDQALEMDLHQALDQLPESSRTIVTLRYFEDLTLDEISAVTGIHLSTVKTRLYQSLKRLRQILDYEEKGGQAHGSHD